MFHHDLQELTRYGWVSNQVSICQNNCSCYSLTNALCVHCSCVIDIHARYHFPECFQLKETSLTSGLAIEERLALQMSNLRAIPFVLNALQMKSYLRALTIKKSPHHWSANQTLIREIMIVLCVHSFCFTIGQDSFLILASDNLYTSACLHLQNVNLP